MPCFKTISEFFKDFWSDVRSESTENLHVLLYFFLLLGIFFLALSFSYPQG